MRNAVAAATVGTATGVELPPAALRAQLAPKTVNPKTRTVELTWTTGQRVLRSSALDGEPYYEELEVSPRAVDLRRLKRGANLLAAHQATTLEGILGVVEDAWLTDGAGHARVRFSARPPAAEVFADVKAGIIRNVSVGYITHEAEELDRERGEPRVVRATRWEPLELSLVAVPADAGATVRAAAGTQYPCTIRRRAMLGNVHPSQRAAVPGADADNPDVRPRPIPAVVDPPAAPAVRRVDLPAPRATAAAMSRALLYQVDPGRFPLPTGSRSLAGFRPYELARRALESAGVRTGGMSPYELAGLALGLVRPERVRGDGFLTVSDFPAAMLQLARATLTEGYTGAPRTFSVWTRRTTLPDFRPMYRIALGTAPKLFQVPEHGEYQHGRSQDIHVETNQLKTWGRILAVTRQALVNDDLSAFSRLAQQFGYSAAQMEGDVVYGILTGNPVMSDGNALFSTAHGNLASPAGIDLASMTAARQLMAAQKSSDGQVLGITPMFLVCGPLLETAALQFTSSMIVPTTPGSVIPPYFKTLNVVVDPRITDASWYLAASPLQIDTIEYAYLEGAPEGGPTLDSRLNWDIDGIEYRCREDFGAAVIEWRGLVKTPSAS
jgi:phage head maturation protease